MKEYYLAYDSEGNKYIVPFDDREKFDEWDEIPSDQEDAWDGPPVGELVEGETIIFTNYRLE